MAATRAFSSAFSSWTSCRMTRTSSEPGLVGRDAGDLTGDGGSDMARGDLGCIEVLVRVELVRELVRVEALEYELGNAVTRSGGSSSASGSMNVMVSMIRVRANDDIGRKDVSM